MNELGDRGGIGDGWYLKSWAVCSLKPSNAPFSLCILSTTQHTRHSLDRSLPSALRILTLSITTMSASNGTAASNDVYWTTNDPRNTGVIGYEGTNPIFFRFVGSFLMHPRRIIAITERK
jgi:hypothetical protein